MHKLRVVIEEQEEGGSVTTGEKVSRGGKGNGRPVRGMLNVDAVRKLSICYPT